MKRKQTKCECMVLYANGINAFTTEYEKVKNAKNEGWKEAAHYRLRVNPNSSVKFTQEICWFNMGDRFDDDPHGRKLVFEECNAEKCSEIASSIAELLNYETDNHVFFKNFLGEGSLRRTGRAINDKDSVHLWILIKRVEVEEPPVPEKDEGFSDLELEEKFKEIFGDCD